MNINISTLRRNEIVRKQSEVSSVKQENLVESKQINPDNLYKTMNSASVGAKLMVNSVSFKGLFSKKPQIWITEHSSRINEQGKFFEYFRDNKGNRYKAEELEAGGVRKIKNNSTYIKTTGDTLIKVGDTQKTLDEIFEKHSNGRYVVGRNSSCDIVIPDKTVSGQHFVCFKNGGNYYISDLNSTNSTILRRVITDELQPSVSEVSRIKSNNDIFLQMQDRNGEKFQARVLQSGRTEVLNRSSGFIKTTGDSCIEIGDSKDSLNNLFSKLPNGKYIVGRNLDNDIVFDDDKVSRVHMVFYKNSNDYYIKDLGSLNHTIVSAKNKTFEPIFKPSGTIIVDTEDIQKAKNELSMYRTSSGNIDYKAWGDNLYNQIRRINPQNLTAPNNPLQAVINDVNTENNYKNSSRPCANINRHWVSRGKNSYELNSYAVDRASLCVMNNPNLIYELDALMMNNIYWKNGMLHRVQNMTPFYYKTPADAKKWFTREDPITMYFCEEVNQETKDAIVEITRKYRQDSLHNAKGKDVDWLVFEEYPTTESIKNLIEESKKYDSALASYIHNSGRYQAGEYNMSTGEFEAVKHMLNTLKLVNM